jgi:hypothetical protein
MSALKLHRSFAEMACAVARTRTVLRCQSGILPRYMPDIGGTSRLQHSAGLGAAMKTSPRITTSASTDHFAAADRPADQQRHETRLCTVYLFAAASTESDEGFCRVKNISDQGMMAITGLDVAVGEYISITLSDAITLSAEIIWADSGRIGLQFSRPIDSASVLEALTEKGSRTHRPPRLVIGLVGTAVTEDGIQPIRALDISQTGMKIAYDGSLEPGVRIKVVLENGIEQRGVVKWSKNQVAGLRFLKPIPCEMVDSVAKMNRIGPTVSAMVPIFPGQHSAAQRNHPRPIEVRLG